MIKNVGYRWFSLLFSLAVLTFSIPVAAQVPAAKLVMVNLTRVDFSDFNTADYPYLQWLLTEGQVGLVMLQVAGRLTPEKVYPVLNGGFSGGTRGEEAAGGLIGSSLRQAGKRTAFLGNADLPWQPNRSAKNLLADAYGAVDIEISDGRVLRSDPTFPFGFRTDYERLGDLVLTLLPTTEVILVETGDLERLEAYRGLMAEAQWQRQRAATLARIDAFLARLRAAPPGKTAIMLLVAAPSATADGNDLPFLPLLIDRKRARPGLLTSSATRQPGLITAGDLVALINDLTGERPGQTGDSWTTDGTWSALQEERLYWGINLRQRMIILRLYVYFLIFLLFLALWMPLTPWRRLTKFTRAFLPVVAAFPFTLLLVAPLRIANLPFLALLLVLGSGSLWALLRWWGPTRLLAYRRLFIGMALAILVDLLFGAKLMRSSLLGPSPVLGHRFYGLGNEYLGILLGSFLLGTTELFLHAPWREWSGLLLGTVVMLVISPLWGANFGGGVALGYAAVLIMRRLQPLTAARWNRFIFSSCLLVGLGVQLFGVGLGGTSHLHNALRLLRLGAWERIAAIAGRKIRMNLGLIAYSLWGPVLLL
ncbi:MAG: hypothetical protein GX202_06235, partial [Firmicutes bacterium]|nr:hypothetical protein [Bacillota bacterium]